MKGEKALFLLLNLSFIVILTRVTKTSSINRAWHEKNRMPANANFEQRVKWHMEHKRHCSCRPIPKKLVEEMKKKGLSL